MGVLAGHWTAIDTETLLIDEDKPREVPDLVVMTVYDGGNFVHLVTWNDVPAYLDELLKKDTCFVFHNAPFDMRVLGLDKWIPIIDRGRVIDTGLQWVLFKMGTVGLSDEADEYPKLARVVKDVLNQDLEKDNAIRCTFERGMVLDDVHAEYACGDAVATWLAAVARLSGVLARYREFLPEPEYINIEDTGSEDQWRQGKRRTTWWRQS